MGKSRRGERRSAIAMSEKRVKEADVKAEGMMRHDS
jgi:hypothetical protein